MRSTTRRVGLIAAVSIIGFTLAGCATTGGAREGGGASGSWTAAEVAEATGTDAVVPLYSVPKDIPELQFGFANPGLSYPFFAEWSRGMHDAADFYGVKLDEVDLDFAFEDSLSAYEQMSVKSPVVVGSLGGAFNAAVVSAAEGNGAKVVVIDGALDGASDFGVSADQVGALAIEAIKPAADQRLAGDWTEREVLIVGISTTNCEPCDQRVAKSFSDAEAAFGITEDRQFRIQPEGPDPASAAQDMFADFLTAHPGSAILVVSYGDEPVIGAVNAAKAANRAEDVLAVANGGDPAARAALRDASNAGILVGAVDYKPYSEGWNWVEAAIAVHLGDKFDKYEVTRILTAENVDDFYPEG